MNNPEEKGCIHLYHGDGKGKTSCAMGLALRCSAYGKKVLIVQFLKDGSSGEVRQLGKIANIEIKAESLYSCFSWDMTAQQKADTKVLHDGFLEFARENSWDLLVLDEVCAALSGGMLSEDLVKQLILEKKPNQEMVFTGRNPPTFLIEKADYITKMEAERHPYEKGISAREGIEF